MLINMLLGKSMINPIPNLIRPLVFSFAFFELVHQEMQTRILIKQENFKIIASYIYKMVYDHKDGRVFI